MKSIKSDIEFKGTKVGFIIVVNNNLKLEEAKKNIIEKINSNLFFFKGSQFCDIYATNINDVEKGILINFLRTNYNIKFTSNTLNTKENESIISDIVDLNESKKDMPTKFIRNTIRSGAFIEYDGNIIVLGDVNPGAQLTAGGNIVIMGSLRGIAHAGYKGDDTAFVSALKLNPIQLRIATVIAISPDEEINIGIIKPQIAFVHDGNIVIENYPTKI